MGQYYRGVVLDTKEENIKVKFAFSPYAHNNGAKLMEHSYVGNYYVKAYEYLLANDYYDSNFVWVGDYADEKDGKDVYSLADDFIEISERVCGMNRYNIENAFDMTLDDLPTYKYIINFTKNIFVRIPQPSKDDLVIHPLPLLCASGNGRGGGDYDGTNMSMIGSWAYDRIGVSNELPNDITKELIITFDENDEGENFKFV